MGRNFWWVDNDVVRYAMHCYSMKARDRQATVSERADNSSWALQHRKANLSWGPLSCIILIVIF